MDLDAGRAAPDMRDQAPRQMPAAHPQPMRHPIAQQRLKPRIAQHDFETRAGRRVAGQGCVNLVGEVFEEHLDHYVIVETASAPAVCAAASRAPRRAYNCPTIAIKFVAMAHSWATPG